MFRLNGSLPKEVVLRLREERDLAKKELLKKGLPNEVIKQELNKMRRLYFGKFDDLLDNVHTGPHFLKQPDVAKIVADAILHFNEERYTVINYCIMSNHVHLTLSKLQGEIGDLLGSIKKFTARKINLLHDCVGRQVWVYESYDHLIRDEEDLIFHHTYTLENPVKAGIVSSWLDFPFTYARPEFDAFYIP